MKNIFSTKNKKQIFLCLLFTLFFSISFCQTKDATMIRYGLQKQEDAWNKGDLENYMQGYWKNDSVMFIGKSGITYGWQKTLAFEKNDWKFARNFLFVIQKNKWRVVYRRGPQQLRN